MRTINNGMTCQFRKASDSSRILEEMPFPEVPRESGTEMGIKNVAEALDTGEETQGPIQLARRSQEMLMGMIESDRLGGMRVSLPMVNRALYVGRPDW